MSGKYDIIVYGATGFTGQLVARYFLQHDEMYPTNPKGLKWAIAGRNEAKLQQIKDKIKSLEPSIPSKNIDGIPTVIADSHDVKKLSKLVKSTRVVVTLVGPYAKYGSLLVKLCAENGVHYCDLTGEAVWVKEMIDTYESIAQKSGARIVPSCGFESIPSDMTTFQVVDYMHTKLQAKPGRVSLYFRDFKGAISGGTCASVLNMFDNYSTRDLVCSSNPYMYMEDKPANVLVRANLPDPLLHYENDMKAWSSIFVGGVLNSLAVHRTNYLLKNYYGDKFVYRERVGMGGFFLQLLMTIAVGIVGILIYFNLTRAIVRRFLPTPGEGPSEEALKTGYMYAEAYGYTENGELAVKAEIRGVGDPGYDCTAKMIAEVALCLAKNEVCSVPSVPAEEAKKGGFYTPASAFGSKLANRLHSKKLITFDLTTL